MPEKKKEESKRLRLPSRDQVERGLDRAAANAALAGGGLVGGAYLTDKALDWTSLDPDAIRKAKEYVGMPLPTDGRWAREYAVRGADAAGAKYLRAPIFRRVSNDDIITPIATGMKRLKDWGLLEKAPDNPDHIHGFSKGPLRGYVQMAMEEGGKGRLGDEMSGALADARKSAVDHLMRQGNELTDDAVRDLMARRLHQIDIQQGGFAPGSKDMIPAYRKFVDNIESAIPASQRETIQQGYTRALRQKQDLSSDLLNLERDAIRSVIGKRNANSPTPLAATNLLGRAGGYKDMGIQRLMKLSPEAQEKVIRAVPAEKGDQLASEFLDLRLARRFKNAPARHGATDIGAVLKYNDLHTLGSGKVKKITGRAAGVGAALLGAGLLARGGAKYLAKKRKEEEKGEEKTGASVTLITGNPDHIEGNARAAAYYATIERLLRKRGHEVKRDPGLPYTVPEESDLWIGHSRGADRLRFAPEHTETLAFGAPDYPGAINHPSDGEKAGPEDAAYEPPSEHYIFTTAQRKALMDTLNKVASTDVILKPMGKRHHWHVMSDGGRAGKVYIEDGKINVFINQMQQRKGIGTEALRQATEESGLYQIDATLRKNNIGARRAAEAAGFRVVPGTGNQISMRWTKGATKTAAAEPTHFAHRTTKENLNKILSSGQIKSVRHLKEDGSRATISVQGKQYADTRQEVDVRKAYEQMKKNGKDPDNIYLTRDGVVSKNYGDYVILKKLRHPTEATRINDVPNEFVTKRRLSIKNNAEIYVPDEEMDEWKKKHREATFRPMSSLPVRQFNRRNPHVLAQKAAKGTWKSLNKQAMTDHDLTIEEGYAAVLHKHANSWEMSADFKKPYEMGVYSKKSGEDNRHLATVSGVSQAALGGAVSAGTARALTGQPTTGTALRFIKGGPSNIQANLKDTANRARQYQKQVGFDRGVKHFAVNKAGGQNLNKSLMAGARQVNWGRVLGSGARGAATGAAAYSAYRMLSNRAKYNAGHTIANTQSNRALQDTSARRKAKGQAMQKQAAKPVLYTPAKSVGRRIAEGAGIAAIGGTLGYRSGKKKGQKKGWKHGYSAGAGDMAELHRLEREDLKKEGFVSEAKARRMFSSNARLNGSTAMGINLDNSDSDFLVVYNNAAAYEKAKDRLQKKYDLKPSPFNERRPQEGKDRSYVLQGEVEGNEVDVVLAYGPKAQARLSSVAKVNERLTDKDREKIRDKKRKLKNAWIAPDTRYKRYKRKLDKDLGVIRL